MAGDQGWYREALSILKATGAAHVRSKGGHAIWRVNNHTVAVPAHGRACGSPRAQKKVLSSIRRAFRAEH